MGIAEFLRGQRERRFMGSVLGDEEVRCGVRNNAIEKGGILNHD